MILIMCLMQENLKHNATRDSMFRNCLKLRLKDIVQLFLRMDKLVLEKLIPWLENKSYSLDKYIKAMKGKV